MKNIPTHRILIPILRTFSTIFAGLVIGASASLFVVWIFFNATESDSHKTDPEKDSSQVNVSIFGDESIGVNVHTSDELSYSDLRKLSESFRTLSPRELQDLLKQSISQPSTSRLFTFQQTLIEYLVESSPEDALTSIAQISDSRRHALLRVIFANWSKQSLEQALTAVTELSHTDRQVAINTIVGARSDLTLEELSELVSRFNLSLELLIREQELKTYELLDQEPFRAIELLAEDEIDDSQQIELYRLIAEKWYQSDGMSIILQLEDARLSSGVFSELFEQVTEQDRKAALVLFSTVEDTRRSSLSHPLIDHWVAADVDDALQAIKSLSQSNFRRSMLSSLAYEWGRKDPAAVLDRLMELPRSVRDDAVSTAAGELAIDGPKEVLDRLSSLHDVPGANVPRAIESVVNTWASANPKQALDWVQSNSKKGTSSREQLLREVLPELALVAPEQAMTIAVAEFNPAFYNSSNLQHHVISSLLFADKFDEAIELLDRVHDAVKLWEYQEVGLELLEHDRLDDTLSLADSLTDEEQIDYFNRVVSGAVIFSRTSAVLELIAKLPTTEMQAGIAEQLLSQEYSAREFTTEQLETLRGFVSE